VQTDHNHELRVRQPEGYPPEPGLFSQTRSGTYGYVRGNETGMERSQPDVRTMAVPIPSEGSHGGHDLWLGLWRGSIMRPCRRDTVQSGEDEGCT